MLDTDFARAPDSRTWYHATLALIGGLLALRLLALVLSPVALYADESQYWVWSREFDWGYFSKPPMIAWLIGLSTALLGDSDFAVRLPAALLHSATALFLYAAARLIWDRRTGFAAALIYITMPGVWLSAVVMSTDALLLTCFSGALLALLHLRRGAGARTAAALGLAIGLGFLSKYAMIYFVVGTAIGLVVDATLRRTLVGRNGLIAGLVVVACLTPNLLWNAANDFATVSHTAANANWGGDLFHPAELADFVGEQFGVFGPILFPVLLVICVQALRRVRGGDRTALLLVFYVLPPLLVVSLQSFISRAHANWAASAYVAGTLLVAAFLMRGPVWRRWVLAGSVAIHTLIGVGVMTLAASPALVEAIGADNATKRIRAWPETAAAIEAAAGEEYRYIVFDDRNIFHQTQRYAPELDGRMRMWWRYAGPINHAEQVWPLAPDEDGPLLIVSHRPLEVARMRDDFEVFESRGTLAIPLDGDRTRDFTLWHAEGQQRVPRDAAYETRWRARDAALDD
ncbi:ArnT family glycosyltransferase [Maricaulis sp. CAU 1757]